MKKYKAKRESLRNWLAWLLGHLCKAPGSVVEFEFGDEFTGPFWYARRGMRSCITGDRLTARAFIWGLH